MAYPKGVKRCGKCNKKLTNCTCVRLPEHPLLPKIQQELPVTQEPLVTQEPRVTQEPQEPIFEKTEPSLEPIPLPQHGEKQEGQVEPKNSNSTSIIAPIIATVDTALQAIGVPSADPHMQQATIQMLSSCVDISVIERKTITMQAESVIGMTLLGYFVPRLLQSPVVMMILNRLLAKLFGEKQPSQQNNSNNDNTGGNKDGTDTSRTP